MNTSPLPALQRVATVILSAGHGGGDPGAVNGEHREADQAKLIVGWMADLLRLWHVPTIVVPHDLGLSAGIAWVNNRFGYGTTWALEIHRDSADGLAMGDASYRCGIYTGASASSRAVGAFMRTAMIKHGAHWKSWCRPDTESRHHRLAWIRQPKPLSHLLELGFMEGDKSNGHLRRLAEIAAKAVAEAVGGTRP